MLIQPYRQTWVEDFNRIRELIKDGLSGADLAVEHVGSTAVQHLAAKPIIDIDVVYDAPDAYERIKAGLERLGYFHCGDQGITGREVFKRDKSKKGHPVLDSIPHHLYVCRADNEELQRHLIFRDYLRQNEQTRKEYEGLKLQIAEKANQDKKVYAYMKETMARAFVESIIQKAKDKPKA